MSARQWFWLLGLLLVMATAAGCGKPTSNRRDVDFTPLALEEAPAELEQHYEEMKALPGLFVLKRGPETYLLLMAGSSPEPDTAVEVLDIRKTGNAWRLLAVMQPGKAKGATYPFAVVKLTAPPGTEFKARLTRPDGHALELKGMSIGGDIVDTTCIRCISDTAEPVDTPSLAPPTRGETDGL